MKIRPVGAKVFHVDIETDGRTDMTISPYDEDRHSFRNVLNCNC
jgi:hypothetical protein